MTDEVTFDGRTIPMVPGQTVAAVLIAAGFRSWRTTLVDRRPRGLFCGIGICFDCLVTVNGVPSVRACIIEARPGDVISSHAV
jgi:hypothetical protein